MSPQYTSHVILKILLRLVHYLLIQFNCNRGRRSVAQCYLIIRQLRQVVPAVLVYDALHAPMVVLQSGRRPPLLQVAFRVVTTT